jgi:L-fucose isomerase-like protein
MEMSIAAVTFPISLKMLVCNTVFSVAAASIHIKVLLPSKLGGYVTMFLDVGELPYTLLRLTVHTGYHRGMSARR